MTIQIHTTAPAGSDGPRPSAHGPAVSLDDRLAEWALSYPADPALMFLDYSTSEHGTAEELTWAGLDRRVDLGARRLQETVGVGDRVAVMTPQGIDFVVCFLAAQRIGAIPVPLFPPGLPGHAERLASTLGDCAPAALVTATTDLAATRSLVDDQGWEFVREVIATTEAPRDGSPARRATGVVGSDPAYLQYTSGSTAAPRGVIIRHDDVRSNAEQTIEAYVRPAGRRTTMVSWLPLFHDMGLMLTVATPLVARLRSVLMDPIAFLQQPGRWMRLLSDHDAAVTAAPNFAYGYAAARVGEDERAWLQLDGVAALINGAEPVHAASIDRFHDSFAECGLPREVHRSSYGLAEATVFVSVSAAGRQPPRIRLDRHELAAGRALEVDDGDHTILVSAGRPVGQDLRIVEPRSMTELPARHVGEIWVHGPNVGAGYWGAPETSGDTFGGVLTGDDQARRWLRTGDLGVLVDDELYITGRLKDLIVIGGRNHYPQDVELTVESAHRAIRRRNVAAFAVPAGEEEAMVIIAERARDATEAELTDVAAAVRAAVGERHGVAVHDFLLLPPGGVPRTSSGKIARSASCRSYLAGELE